MTSFFLAQGQSGMWLIHIETTVHWRRAAESKCWLSLGMGVTSFEALPSLLRFCLAGTCDSLVKIITVFDVIYLSVWLSLENAVFMKLFTTSDFSQSFYPPLLFTLIIESWEAWLNINIQFRTEHPRVSYSLHMNPLHAAMLIVIYC